MQFIWSGTYTVSNQGKPSLDLEKYQELLISNLGKIEYRITRPLHSSNLGVGIMGLCCRTHGAQVWTRPLTRSCFEESQHSIARSQGLSKYIQSDTELHTFKYQRGAVLT